MKHHWLWVGVLFVGMAGVVTGAEAQEQKVGAPPEVSNMKLLGWSDLQARSAYQPTIHKQGNRFIAYIGHHGGTDDIPTPVNPMTGKPEPNGTSIVDVTDPANPKYLRHLPGQPGKYEVKVTGSLHDVAKDGASVPRSRDRHEAMELRCEGITLDVKAR